MKVNTRCDCGSKLDKDTVALNKKLLGRQVKVRMCLSCLAKFSETTVERLKERIEMFKAQGCGLFS